jgi:hypothetical protein
MKVRELGSLVAGLSPTQFATIPAGAMQGLTVTAVKILPIENVRVRLALY